MPDVQFAHLANGGDRLDVLVVQAVPRVHLQASGSGSGDHAFDTGELPGSLGAVPGVGEPPGVHLDDGGSGLQGRLDLARVRVDEERRAHSRRRQALAGVAHRREVSRDVEPTLGRQFLAALRHEATIGRADSLGHREAVGGDGHLQVHPGQQDLPQDLQVAHLDVPPILAQMNGDSVGPGELCVDRRLDRVRIARPPGLAKGRHVVDIHTQQDLVPLRHRFSPHAPYESRPSPGLRKRDRLSSGRSPR